MALLKKIVSDWSVMSTIRPLYISMLKYVSHTPRIRVLLLSDTNTTVVPSCALFIDCNN